MALPTHSDQQHKPTLTLTLPHSHSLTLSHTKHTHNSYTLTYMKVRVPIAIEGVALRLPSLHDDHQQLYSCSMWLCLVPSHSMHALQSRGRRRALREKHVWVCVECTRAVVVVVASLASSDPFSLTEHTHDPCFLSFFFFLFFPLFFSCFSFTNTLDDSTVTQN